MTNIKHILKSQQFDIGLMAQVFILAEVIKKKLMDPTGAGQAELEKILPNKKMMLLFYEPSTRTRFSFEMGALHLGMKLVDSENAKEFSSAIKGESLQDSFEVVCGYHPHVIVLRHMDDDSAEIAAEICDRFNISLINAGAGKFQHPTQSLLDAFTIWEKFGNIEDLTVLLGGDLMNGRTVRSLTYLLAKFPKMKFIFLSVPGLRIGEDILQHLRNISVPYECYTDEDDLKKIFGRADVVYWTRTQKERIKRNFRQKIWFKLKSFFAKEDTRLQLNAEKLKWMKEDSMIMHPLPRITEITKEVDKDPRAWYFKEAHNGMYVRAALLLFTVAPEKAKEIIREHSGKLTEE